MRLLILLLFVTVAAVVTAPSLADAQNCQCVCRYDSYGRRHCHKVCTQPRYVAPTPQYTLPHSYSYAPTPSYAAPFEIDPSPLIVIAVLAAIMAALIAAVSSGSSTTDDLIRGTQDIQANTVATRALAEQTRAQTRDLEDEFAARAQQSYRRGREAADEAWDRMMENRRG
jgi:hypothetical protein